MDRLQPQSMEMFQQVLAHNRATGRWQGLILTGSEVTLRRDLPELARQARRHGFRHVRIQTHGMRLAKMDYCRELVDAGVDEFFISVTAGDAATHDAITKAPGSFDRTLQGLENLDGFAQVITMTNTVVTARSYRQLPVVVQLLSHLRRLVQMHFWTYWPMGEKDEKNLIVRHTEAAPYLQSAVRLARRLGRDVEVKNFPECMLGSERDALENTQPQLFIDPAFWTEFDRNGFKQCAHRDACNSTQCLGLNTAYIDKFGWEEEHLTPVSPRTADPKGTC
jgi:MoaA/NifB/PqqE/SkfB family radical SAM enzyme